jgi:hypothetical protein
VRGAGAGRTSAGVGVHVKVAAAGVKAHVGMRAAGVGFKAATTSKLIFSRKVHKISRTREMCFWISNFTQTFAGLFYVISDPKVRTSEQDIAYPKYVPSSF